MTMKSETNRSQTTVETACALCGSRGSVLFEGRDLLHGVDGSFGVSECGECGFAFTSPRPTEKRLGDYYPAEYSPHEPRIADESGVRERVKRAVLGAFLGYPVESRLPVPLLWPAYMAFRWNSKNIFYVPWHGQGRILDVGCGSGRWLWRLSKAGWRTAGLDISRAAAETAQETYGVEVKVGTYPHRHYPDGSFDVVTLWNSLEHMWDPLGVLKSCAAVLAGGGLLYMSVPNFASFGSRYFRENWFPLDLPRHLNHFTPGTLAAAAGASGFEVSQTTALRRTSALRKSARYARSTGDARLAVRVMTTRLGAGIMSRLFATRGRCELMVACCRKVRDDLPGT